MRLVREILKDVSLGRFEVTNAGRLDEALEALSEREFDAVLLDLRLPDSEGFDTFAAVHKRSPDMPIVDKFFR